MLFVCMITTMGGVIRVHWLALFTCCTQAIRDIRRELARDATPLHSLLTPSIFIMLQLLAIIVIAMPLSLHEKSWHVDRVPARTITHRRVLLLLLLTRPLPVPS